MSCYSKQGYVYCEKRTRCYDDSDHFKKIKLFYRIEGLSKPNKPTMVFVHGDDSNGSVWKCQQDFFCKYYQTISIDMRGFGKSSKVGPLDIETHRDDLKFLLEELGLLCNKIYLIGWSLGGLVAQSYILAYPRDVAKLVLVDTGPQVVSTCKFPYGRSLSEQTEIFYTMLTDFPKYIIQASQLIVPETCPGANHVRKVIAQQLKETGKDIALRQIWEACLYSTVEQLPSITTPTLVVLGLKDTYINPQSSKYIHLNIPNSQIIEFPDAGHVPFLTFVTKFNQQLLIFFEDTIENCQICKKLCINN